jgi:hypothetical protein
VQNNQVQGERAAIYRRSPRVRVLNGPNWAGPNMQTGCAKYFPE